MTCCFNGHYYQRPPNNFPNNRKQGALNDSNLQLHET